MQAVLCWKRRCLISAAVPPDSPHIIASFPQNLLSKRQRNITWERCWRFTKGTTQLLGTCFLWQLISIPLFTSILPFTVSVGHENCPQQLSIAGLLLRPSTWCHEACSPASSQQSVWMHFLSAQTWMILKEDSDNNNRFLEVQCLLNTVKIWESYS